MECAACKFSGDQGAFGLLQVSSTSCACFVASAPETPAPAPKNQKSWQELLRMPSQEHTVRYGLGAKDVYICPRCGTLQCPALPKYMNEKEQYESQNR